MTTQEIIEVIKGLSVLELNDLVKACEEEFGVSAAAGVVVAAAGAGRHSFQRRTSRKTAWKHPVSYYQLCSCA